MVTVTYCQKTEAFDFKVPIGADEALSSYIRDSVTRLGDFLDFWPLLKPSAAIDFPKFSHILWQFF